MGRLEGGMFYVEGKCLAKVLCHRGLSSPPQKYIWEYKVLIA